MTEQVVIAKLGLEGGGATILGIRVDRRWSFWHEGSSIALDENDEEKWRAWASEQTDDLAAMIPSNWPLMFPMTVHPDFVCWFRDHYEAARVVLSEDAREYQTRHPDGWWQQIFAGPREAEQRR